jgi:hypothetical protein
MRQLRAGLIGLLALSAACGASRSPASGSGPNPSPTAASGAKSARVTIPVQVDNQNFNDMNIYVLNRGARWLLGQANGLSKTTLTIPVGVTGADAQVRLLAEPIGGTRPIATPVLTVPPGESVYWTIGSDPATSSASAG